MKTAFLLVVALSYTAALGAAETNPKVAEMLAAKDDQGKTIVGPEEQKYYAGLNDNLKELLNRAAKDENITRAEHLAALLSLQLVPQKMELLLQNNCILCHSDSANHSTDTLFALTSGNATAPSHMNLREIVEDVHFRRGISCAGCHGGDPAAPLGHDHVKEWPEKDRKTNREWVVAFCARCHSDPTFMHQYNAALPTDQLAKFKESPHGKTLLEKHDSRAAQCVSCHGVHGIRPAKDPQSKVYAQRVPETCGACHANAETMAGFTRADGSPLPVTQLAEYKTSVHGKALARGDLGAPRCNTCHGNHAATPPGVAGVSRSCSLCHSANAGLFDGSKHKQAFDKHGWPECGMCHGNHAIAKTNDSMLSTAKGGLCGDCHRDFSKDNPDCIATADFFHQTITQIGEAREKFHTEAEKLAAKGLDTELINNQLTEITDGLRKSRTHIHSFSRDTFQQVAMPALQAAQNTEGLVKKAREEYNFRQFWLVLSIGIIGLLMLTIYLKLRRLEQEEQ